MSRQWTDTLLLRSKDDFKRKNIKRKVKKLKWRFEMKLYRKIKNNKVKAIINTEIKRAKTNGDTTVISVLKTMSKKYY